MSRAIFRKLEIWVQGAPARNASACRERLDAFSTSLCYQAGYGALSQALWKWISLCCRTRI